MGFRTWLVKRLVEWLLRDEPYEGVPPCDFDQLSFEIRPCDVLLVEGRSRVSHVIKSVTLSPWTHSALYIGRLHDIEDSTLRDRVKRQFKGSASEQLLIEPLLGRGTVITPLKHYRGDHLRICRPKGLTRQDAPKVVNAAVSHVGTAYDLRQLLDLARFLYPYSLLPPRWRSSLFQHHAGQQTKTVCSTMIAEVFAEVHYPVLPVIHRSEDGQLRLYKRNTKLYTPSDFDYSPYFEIIKYPILGFDDVSVYRQLPWNEDGVVCNTAGDCFVPPPLTDGDDGQAPADPTLARISRGHTG